MLEYELEPGLGARVLPYKPKVAESSSQAPKDHYIRVAGRLYRNKDAVVPELEKEFNFRRIEALQSYLWLVAPQLVESTRPLHVQRVLSREILPVEQADLHLVSDSSRIYIKPLPAVLLEPAFFEEYILQSNVLFGNVCGFLLSYVYLIQTELDFRIAKSVYLIPEDLNWMRWAEIREHIKTSVNADDMLHTGMRFRFGELRMQRLNLIQRFKSKALNSKGYLRLQTGEYSYSDLIAIWALVFTGLSIILSAMQVALGTSQGSGILALNSVSYGFSVGSMLLIIVPPVLYLGSYLTILLYNVLLGFLFALSFTMKRQTASGTSK